MPRWKCIKDGNLQYRFIFFLSYLKLQIPVDVSAGIHRQIRGMRKKKGENLTAVVKTPAAGLVYYSSRFSVSYEADKIIMHQTQQIILMLFPQWPERLGLILLQVSPRTKCCPQTGITTGAKKLANVWPRDTNGGYKPWNNSLLCARSLSCSLPSSSASCCEWKMKLLPNATSPPNAAVVQLNNSIFTWQWCHVSSPTVTTGQLDNSIIRTVWLWCD